MTEIYLVARGTATARVEGKTIALRAGDMLAFAPGEAHTFLASSADYLHFVVHIPALPDSEAHADHSAWRATGSGCERRGLFVTTTLKETALLPLSMLLVLGLLWVVGLALARWRPVRGRWPELAGEWGMVGALAALNLAFFWRVLLTRDTWLPRGGGDFNSFYYPLYPFAARSIGAGDFPLWNPHLYSGMPFAADQQTGLFSPINLLAFLLANPFGYGTLEMLAIVQVFLASLTAYAFCRDLGARRAAALIGGVTFAYSGFIVSHLGHYPMVAVAPWLPVAFLTLRRALTAA